MTNFKEVSGKNFQEETQILLIHLLIQKVNLITAIMIIHRDKNFLTSAIFYHAKKNESRKKILSRNPQKFSQIHLLKSYNAQKYKTFLM